MAWWGEAGLSGGAGHGMLLHGAAPLPGCWDSLGALSSGECWR